MKEIMNEIIIMKDKMKNENEIIMKE